MTQTTKHLGWQRRTGFLALGAALALTATFGPTMVGTTRYAASEVAGHATVTVADTITSTPVLAEVAAAGRGVSKATESV
ncbi:hypothetical protein Ade02nite_25570 [Paractinoplanes deccanensis]|uniref:Uncharacterized protein n=1 Tax=Paractinoplanes deccanensis TaxID=113561 RepID=A0ABQ3Y1Q5_9ACTN|nr:hypothetical protein [Actinoplanes deccanensis]GID73916.1 hypothetical protein Ade02nite_25570 [Actinoplanes deccanensis]